ncbi:UDP-glucose/GDP-mannose dehydrogenase family protein [Candidatus Woesearchaeota archaeon]|mgnify:CR=1 FL=1|jgi:UDPglucose 6-dehydrogenase|nr:UDP-glucose/GDP-mannose dehydrogenase family protein [Candidatus Woesearchaeota archaeon]MBT5397270.1 UDP-glucose/GDP-mannose dehydrogenase family protein [Candidatus Woesearchaeota archaeon]MBT5924255.1 UDP-glucose/GDP-mannose dehydrogenase family protein [Candidatus Woesearchaeota archaeon]MBT6367184.1 UDP-glucose/GDP-mannose dehydrogenase family protein [Candidatus Woesearchaeota archaeon]MBT7762670.1 UDP-glucose/GDP-mannose dehydrogenase family protein [Candidatus Woesearchaeota archaeon
MKITIFGSGYVGLVTGACLANLGHSVLCVDIDSAKISQLQEGAIHFYEPGLKELIVRNMDKGRIRFTMDVKEGVSFGDVIFNCVGTPSNGDGSADLSYVFSVAESVAEFAQGYKVLINKSTVPPGTAKKCSEIICTKNPLSQVEVVSNPEFLKEGAAVHDFTHPDKIVVGAKTDTAFALLRKVYTGRVRTYIPVLETSWETAEMIKYANNSFLSTKISFINEIANICDAIGADVKVVSQAMGMDYRISPKFLNAGIGYGGSCFPKDVRALVATATSCGYDASLLRSVDLVNTKQKLLLLDKVVTRFGSLSGRVFSILGISFKPKTSDVREAASLVLIKGLLDEGAIVKVYDPVAMDEAQKVFGDSVIYCSSVVECVSDSSAIFLITEWDEFRNVNFRSLGEKMKDKVVFDGRNIYEPELVKEEGFEYVGIGRR